MLTSGCSCIVLEAYLLLSGVVVVVVVGLSLVMLNNNEYK